MDVDHRASHTSLAETWHHLASQYEQTEDVSWAEECLRMYLQGHSPSADQQQALQSLSDQARSSLSATASDSLTHEARQIIGSCLDQLRSGQESRGSVADVLTQASHVHQRWVECIDVLGCGAPSALPLWMRICVENVDDIIEAAIYADLRGGHPVNAVKEPLSRLGLDEQWSLFCQRAAHTLALDRVKAVEEDVDNFEMEALDTLQSWLETSLLHTLKQWQAPHLEAARSRLEYEMLIELGQIRARQLFDIIKDFPSSSPALMDLNACSEQCDLQAYISSQLSTALEGRLLHPGASTRDIVQFYTHLIRGLRFIDPSGVILSHVIGPVRTYLRARPDTISVIVASLLGQAGDFTLLRDMMLEADAAQGLGGGPDTSLAVYEEEPDAANGGAAMAMNSLAADESKRMFVLPAADEQDWAPRPINAGPDYRQSRKSDVIAIIVSIFDDEEGFVTALEKSCAEQLIKVQNYDASKAYETNENLKKRFGDAPFSKCNVMLNDITKSLRYDRSIHREEQPIYSSKTGALASLHPLVLSRQFWPLSTESAAAPAASLPSGSSSSMFASTANVTTHGKGTMSALSLLQSKSIKMPGQFAKAMEQYAAAFKARAPTQRLCWLHPRGNVKVRLEMDDGRQICDTVTPIQASVIELAAITKASTTKPLTVMQMIADLEANKDEILGAVLYWTSRGVLKATDGTSEAFAVVEEASV